MKKFLLVLLWSLILGISVAGQKHASERDMEGLRGKVKSVITEAILESPSGKPARILMMKMTFDADGNLNTREDYGPSGELLNSSAFSFLEGERVVKMESITPKNVVILGDPTKIKRSTDPRYTYKIRYKFDSLGRRIAADWLRSDDSIYLKYVYSYNDNKIEETVTFDKGLTLEDKVSTLDQKGNTLEVLHRAPSDKSEYYKESYTDVRVDNQGNWVERIESRTRNNKLVESLRVSRTITYH
jgi:hypothetical protein